MKIKNAQLDYDMRAHSLDQKLHTKFSKVKTLEDIET